ncbi:MAG: DUF4388 domain-containing protein [Nitrospiraceae bacterium]|nr:DUF4388 domain-containing protein [Nitrospiraceae bacterium]
MNKKLSDLIIELCSAQKTGQLTLPIHGGSHHLKIFLRDGKLYHLACGKMSGVECLQLFSSATITDGFFLPNLKTSIIQSDLPSAAEIARHAEHLTIEFSARESVDAGQTSTSSAAPVSGTSAQGFSAVSDGLKTALMKQVGPIGAKIMTRLVAQWLSSPQSNDLSALVRLLSEQIDDLENRNIFLREAENLLKKK